MERLEKAARSLGIADPIVRLLIAVDLFMKRRIKIGKLRRAFGEAKAYVYNEEKRE